MGSEKNGNQRLSNRRGAFPNMDCLHPKKDVKTKSGETIPKGTQVKIVKQKGKKMTIESPDGLTAEIS